MMNFKVSSYISRTMNSYYFWQFNVTTFCCDIFTGSYAAFFEFSESIMLKKLMKLLA